MGIGERTFPLKIQNSWEGGNPANSLWCSCVKSLALKKRHMQTHGTRTETLTIHVTIFIKEECFLSPLWAAFKCKSGFVSCWIKDWHHLLYIFIHLYLTQKHNDCILLVNLKNVFLKSFNFIKLENKGQYHPPGILWGGSSSARAVIQRVRMNLTEVNRHCSADTAKPERTGAAELSPNFSE